MLGSWGHALFISEKKYRTCSSFKNNPHTLRSTTLKSGTECLWQLERGLSERPEVVHLCCIYTCIILPLAAVRWSNTDLMVCLNSEQHAGWNDELPERTRLPVNILLSLWFARCSCVAALQHLSLLLHLSSPALWASLFVSLWAM